MSSTAIPNEIAGINFLFMVDRSFCVALISLVSTIPKQIITDKTKEKAPDFSRAFVGGGHKLDCVNIYFI
jgi:hypothetical protein